MLRYLFGVLCYIMVLSGDQKAISRAILMAIAATVVVGYGAITVDIPSMEATDFESRLFLAARSAIALIMCQMVAIAALARQRFIEPRDMDGTASRGGTDKAARMAPIFQNTLEQGLPLWSIVLLRLRQHWFSWLPNGQMQYFPANEQKRLSASPIA